MQPRPCSLTSSSPSLRRPMVISLPPWSAGECPPGPRAASRSSGPLVAGERAPLRAHDAEALAGGRLHHPPALDEGDALCAQRLQPPRLRLLIVGLDVEVDASLVRNLLDEHERLAGAAGELAVVGLVLRRLVGAAE